MNDNVKEIAKTVPSIGISTLNCFGYPLSEWLILLTIVYTLVQIYYTVKKLRRLQ